ncbi:putative Multidrug resistance pump [Hibiscus syriacus]|uniref:Multidrug resistance pump n=1 Tax=Hibiscus syriacus TaxID=106335 RepID=A0A6A2ZSR3_HIBSY|nr:calmodulin-like protein 30 [Hibiscus syriacus]KAE8695091.1 putative Multidrug resistance pump [Hibiscus syriacus]
MSKPSFTEFKYGSFTCKLSRKLTKQSSISSRERQNSNLSSTTYQPNVEEMKWVFDKYDTNKDGKISKEEYKSALKVLGKGEEETNATKAFTTIDTDGDGFIDFKEFLGMMHNMGEGINVNDIQSAFRVYDFDGNGKISAQELMAVLKKMGERCNLETCRRMIRGVDANEDGLIDMAEFTTMMTRTMKVFQK